MILDEFPALRQLDRTRQMELAFALLDEAHHADPEVSDPVILAVLDQRRTQFEAAPATAQRWEDLRDRILGSRARHA